VKRSSDAWSSQPPQDAVLARAGAETTLVGRAASAPISRMHAVIPESLILRPNGWVLNNPRLPVLLHKGVIEIAGDDSASLLEIIFRRNGWALWWRKGAYDFHRCHSTAHEALALVAVVRASCSEVRTDEKRPSKLVKWRFCQPTPVIVGSRPATTAWWSRPIRLVSAAKSAEKRRRRRQTSAWNTCLFRPPIQCPAARSTLGYDFCAFMEKTSWKAIRRSLSSVPQTLSRELRKRPDHNVWPR
jgi:hypothetical protein